MFLPSDVIASHKRVARRLSSVEWKIKMPTQNSETRHFQMRRGTQPRHRSTPSLHKLFLQNDFRSDFLFFKLPSPFPCSLITETSIPYSCVMNIAHKRCHKNRLMPAWVCLTTVVQQWLLWDILWAVVMKSLYPDPCADIICRSTMTSR